MKLKEIIQKHIFVDLNNNCKMKTDGIDQIIDVSSCELPESFKFGGKRFKRILGK